MSPRTRMVMWVVLPTVAIVCMAVYTIVGSGGVLDYLALRREAEAARAESAEFDRANARRVFEVGTLQQDPLANERLVADEMGAAREGARLYYFEGDEIVRVVP